MSLQDYKITDSDISEKGVVAAPDKLTGTVQENKKIFDRLIRETVKGHYNDLIDALDEAGVNAIIQTGSAGTLLYLRLNADKVLESSADGILWEATGSSGHIVVNQDGTQLPQRSRLKFADCEVEDDGTQTVVYGIVGPQGPKGDQGDQGIQGVKGDKGDTGYSIIPSVDQNTGLMSFTEGPAGVVPSPVYVRGPQGMCAVHRGLRVYRGLKGHKAPPVSKVRRASKETRGQRETLERQDQWVLRGRREFRGLPEKTAQEVSRARKDPEDKRVIPVHRARKDRLDRRGLKEFGESKASRGLPEFRASKVFRDQRVTGEMMGSLCISRTYTLRCRLCGTPTQPAMRKCTRWRRITSVTSGRNLWTIGSAWDR